MYAASSVDLTDWNVRTVQTTWAPKGGPIPADSIADCETTFVSEGWLLMGNGSADVST